MFGISTEKESHQNGGVTVLTEGCHFAGKLFCRGASVIAGKVDGEIISEDVLTIEETAVINAKIKAQKIIIKGKVTGDILDAKEVELCKTASFTGNLRCETLSVESGAVFIGSTTMHGHDTDPLNSGYLAGENHSTHQSNYEIQNDESHRLNQTVVGDQGEGYESNDQFMVS